MVFKKFKEDIVEPYPKSKIVITFYWTQMVTGLLLTAELQHNKTFCEQEPGHKTHHHQLN